jgi:3-hydroxyisobutyrate dehydrogenase-like beta-hydroxyacid dehydrogenase
MANLGYIGLGAMGGNMADLLMAKGHKVMGYNRTAGKADWCQEGHVARDITSRWWRRRPT